MIRYPPMRRLARRILPRRSTVARVSSLGVTWTMAAAFGACVLSLAWAHLRGDGREWRHASGSRTYFWGVGVDAHVGWIERLRGAEPRPGERGDADQWVFTREVSFGVGRAWGMRHDTHYSTTGEVYDPLTGKSQKLVGIRRVADRERTIVLLHLDRCAVVLALPLAVLLFRRARRYAARRRRLDLTHCHACGYDLRATPERCPECGTTKGACGIA